jgi:hypothetical protein
MPKKSKILNFFWKFSKSVYGFLRELLKKLDDVLLGFKELMGGLVVNSLYWLIISVKSCRMSNSLNKMSFKNCTRIRIKIYSIKDDKKNRNIVKTASFRSSLLLGL